MDEKEQRKKEKISMVIYKEQYRLKLGIVYLLASGFNIFAIFISWIIHKSGVSLELVILAYLMCMILYYKFFFNYTKDGYFFKALGFSFLSNLSRKTTKALRKNLVKNSAKQLKRTKE